MENKELTWSGLKDHLKLENISYSDKNSIILDIDKVCM